jgi:histone-lysine N-methyltransferase SETMAR
MAHWALATQKKLAYLGFQCLDHPPYSLDLAPSDYHLFHGLKKTIEREVDQSKDLSAPWYAQKWSSKCMLKF